MKIKKLLMKEHPILFSTPMVKAILEGRKTMTRRKCKHQNWSFSEILDINTNGITQNIDRSVSCPYGQVGDLLWVREKTISNKNSNTYWPVADGYLKTSDYEKIVPSIHMPKLAARIWLKITNVKVERLQDITEANAVKEGITPLLMSAQQLNENGQLYFDYSKPKQFFNDGLPPFWSFNTLWCSINGGDSWEANPWVWAIEFEVLSTTGKPTEI